MPLNDFAERVMHTSSSGKLSHKSTISSKDIYTRHLINSTAAGVTYDDGEYVINDVLSD